MGTKKNSIADTRRIEAAIRHNVERQLAAIRRNTEKILKAVRR